MHPILTLISIIAFAGCSDAQFNEGSTPVEQDATVLDNAKIFHTSHPQSGSVSYHYDSQKLDYKFNLSKPANRSIQHQQLTREDIHFQKTQGQPGRRHMETIKLKTDGPLDLLIVIDNSNTMETYQDRLTDIEPLLGDIYNADWRIGVVTTDNPCLRPNHQPITRDEYLRNPYATLSRFADAIRAGTNGNPVERGVEMAIRGMLGECDGRALNWTRSNAKKAVFLMSDEENCGSAVNEVGCQNDPSSPEQYVYHGPQDYIDQLGSSTKFYALLHSDDICGEDYYDVDPEDYLELVTRTGGMWGPICANDYSPLLKDISKDVGQILLEKVELEYPVDTHLPFEIKVDNIKLDPSMFTIVGNVVKIRPDILKNAEKMEITYTHGSAEVFQKLEFVDAIDPLSLEIYQNDQKLDSSDYVVSSSGKLIEFKHLLPAGAKIEGKYKAAHILLSDFPIPTGIYPHFVRIDSIDLTPSEYELKGDRIYFKKPPSDGALIEIAYNFVHEVQLSYKIDNLPTQGYMEASELRDSRTGTPILHSIQDGVIHIHPSEVKNQREVLFTYQFYPFEDHFTIPLPHTPNEESLFVSAENCQIEAVSNLPQPGVSLYCHQGVPELIEVGYSYQSPIQHIFELEKGASMYRWRVWVDGQITDQYHIEGSWIHIEPKILDAQSVVWVLKAQ